MNFERLIFELLNDELYSERDLVPAKGDFNIIRGALYRVSLTHDYNFVNSKNLWNSLHNVDFLRVHFHPLHCDTTFERNVQSLLFIHKHGWMEFIIRYLNNGI